MTDPVDFALSKLEYLRARLEVMQKITRWEDPTNHKLALDLIDRECAFLLVTITKIRKALDPQLRE